MWRSLVQCVTLEERNSMAAAWQDQLTALASLMRRQRALSKRLRTMMVQQHGAPYPRASDGERAVLLHRCRLVIQAAMVCAIIARCGSKNMGASAGVN